MSKVKMLSRISAILICGSYFLMQSAFATEKNITYMQILQKPNDLELNIKYAQQQGKMGNFKQTISTLERLNMVYPDNIEIKVNRAELTIEGIDKQLVGSVAAKIRSFRKPEPYKGKGVRYKDEFVISKQGKTVGSK